MRETSQVKKRVVSDLKLTSRAGLAERVDVCKPLDSSIVASTPITRPSNVDGSAAMDVHHPLLPI